MRRHLCSYCLNATHRVKMSPSFPLFQNKAAQYLLTKSPAPRNIVTVDTSTHRRFLHQVNTSITDGVRTDVQNLSLGTENISIPLNHAFFEEVLSACGLSPRYDSRPLKQVSFEEARSGTSVSDGTLMISDNPVSFSLQKTRYDATLRLRGREEDVREVKSLISAEMDNICYRDIVQKHRYPKRVRQALYASQLFKETADRENEPDHKIWMKASNFGSMLEISIFGRNKPEIEAFQGKVQTFIDSFRLVKVPILQGAAPIKEIARICSQLTEYNEVTAQFNADNPNRIIVFGAGDNVVKVADNIRDLIRPSKKLTDSANTAPTTMTYHEIPITWCYSYVLRLFKLCGIDVGEKEKNFRVVTFDSVTISFHPTSSLKLIGERDNVIRVRDILTDEMERHHQRRVDISDNPHAGLIRKMMLGSELHKELVEQTDSKEKVWIDNRPHHHPTISISSPFTVTLCGEDRQAVEEIHSKVREMVDNFRVRSVSLPGELPDYLRDCLCVELAQDSEVFAEYNASDILVYGSCDSVDTAAENLQQFLDTFQLSELECADPREVSLFKKLIIDTWYLRSRFPYTFITWDPAVITTTAPLTLKLFGPQSEVPDLRAFLMGWFPDQFTVPDGYDLDKLAWYGHNIRKLPIPVDFKIGENNMEVFGSKDGIKFVQEILDFEREDNKLHNRRFSFKLRYKDEDDNTYLYKSHFGKVLFIASNHFKDRFPLMRWHIIGKELFFTGVDADQAMEYFINSEKEIPDTVTS